jgi:hypothetical protein
MPVRGYPGDAEVRGRLADALFTVWTLAEGDGRDRYVARRSQYRWGVSVDPWDGDYLRVTPAGTLSQRLDGPEEALGRLARGAARGLAPVEAAALAASA